MSFTASETFGRVITCRRLWENCTGFQSSSESTTSSACWSTSPRSVWR